ncbi:MAG: hypothetical protein M1269_08280 [Chloroflexi bacterium]|nr:hypothetical protein [Chloroflexota bacterium]
MGTKKKTSGSAILAAIWVIVIVAMLGFALLSLNAISNSFADKFKRDAAAFEAAQAGIADALHEIVNSDAWDTGFLTLSDVNSEDLWSAGFDNKPAPGGGAEYSLSFNTPVPNTPFFSIDNITGTGAADGYFGAGTVPAGTLQLISVGTSTSGTGRTSRRAVFASIKSVPKSAFSDFAIFSNNSMSFTGNGGTDSWNSAQGTYESTHSNTNGTIGTNGISPSIISLGSHTVIGGDVQIGPDGDPSTAISEGSHSVIYGTKKVASSPVEIPNIVAPSGISMGDVHTSRTLQPGTYSDMTISGWEQVTLTPGTYVFTGDIHISGHASVRISSGQAIVFAKSDVHDTGNGFSNTSERPKNLVLIGTETCTSIHLGGNAESYMGVYAPNADLHYNGNDDFYGSIICKTFTNNGNSVVHRDLDLVNSAPYVGIEVSKKGWSEVK